MDPFADSIHRLYDNTYRTNAKTESVIIGDFVHSGATTDLGLFIHEKEMIVESVYFNDTPIAFKIANTQLRVNQERLERLSYKTVLKDLARRLNLELLITSKKLRYTYDRESYKRAYYYPWEWLNVDDSQLMELTQPYTQDDTITIPSIDEYMEEALTRPRQTIRMEDYQRWYPSSVSPQVVWSESRFPGGFYNTSEMDTTDEG